MAGKKLAKKLWNNAFDLVPTNGHSLKEETKTNVLFHTILTLETMKDLNEHEHPSNIIIEALHYLKSTGYYYTKQ